MKKRKLIFLIFIIALFVGVISRIVYVNITATPIPKVYYPMGETIEYTDDFLFKPILSHRSNNRIHRCFFIYTFGFSHRIHSQHKKCLIDDFSRLYGKIWDKTRRFAAS